MTTRKQARPQPGPVLAAVLLAGTLVGATGCATPGVLHVYTVANSAERPVLDAAPEGTRTTPSFLQAGEQVTGFAYDPFTDHFFLRLAPGDRIRVVDRPARAIKREFEIKGAPAGEGDLAVRPRDGHLFLLGARPGQILQCTRLGKYLGEFTLQGADGPLTGLAYDATQDHLLALGPDGRRVTVHDRRGAFVRELQLEHPVGPGLAYDSDARQFHAPRRDRPGEQAIFDAAGRLLRTTPSPQATALLDVGPRSFIRVF